jgi:hypothetical protein
MLLLFVVVSSCCRCGNCGKGVLMFAFSINWKDWEVPKLLPVLKRCVLFAITFAITLR